MTREEYLKIIKGSEAYGNASDEYKKYLSDCPDNDFEKMIGELKVVESDLLNIKKDFLIEGNKIEQEFVSEGKEAKRKVVKQVETVITTEEEKSNENIISKL
ncbi:MAG TPA: hypothetical protein P5229_01805 [Candidatus Gracilibacteria bacterium]|nr:hypothetical protein [Candidatus Gracilibacteria bacterium]